MGNKTDLPNEREVSLEEGRAFAEEKNIKFFEVSTKTGEGVDNLLKDISYSLTNKFPNIVEKMEDQFLFQRGDEAKKKIQIENSLKIDKEKQKHNYIGKIINTRKIRSNSLLNKYLISSLCFK